MPYLIVGLVAAVVTLFAFAGFLITVNWQLDKWTGGGGGQGLTDAAGDIGRGLSNIGGGLAVVGVGIAGLVILNVLRR